MNLIEDHLLSPIFWFFLTAETHIKIKNISHLFVFIFLLILFANFQSLQF